MERIIQNIILILLVVLTFNDTKASDLYSSNLSIHSPDTSIIEDAVAPFPMIDQEPRFPGCEHLETYREKVDCSQEKMFHYINTKLKYPNEAQKNGIQGIVFIKFVVEKDGSITNAEVLKTPGAGCGTEALRIINSMNSMKVKWIPAIAFGKPAKATMTAPIKFKLD